MNKVFAILLTLLAIVSCRSNNIASTNLPSWYASPKQNDSQNIYGVAVGANLEEATKAALADAAARLMVNISAQSTSLSEEDKNGVNQEIRQQISQNIEKIDFTNFKVQRSQQVGAQLYVEVAIERSPFINDQKEKVAFAERQVDDLSKNLDKSNPIQKRVSLTKILDLQKQIELSSRILQGNGENINLAEKLKHYADFKNQFNQITNQIEFYFEINSAREIAQTIRTALNKEKIKIANSRSNSANQIVIAIKSSSTTNQIYGAYLTKLKVDFANLSNNKTVASNTVEVTGSSTLGEKESYVAAVKSLEDKIAQDGILKVIGIIN